MFVYFFFHIAKPNQDPIITGLMQSYAIGDYIDANCTSDQSNPPSDLTWYINERKVSPCLAESYLISYVNSTLLLSTWQKKLYGFLANTSLDRYEVSTTLSKLN